MKKDQAAQESGSTSLVYIMHTFWSYINPHSIARSHTSRISIYIFYSNLFFRHSKQIVARPRSVLRGKTARLVSRDVCLVFAGKYILLNVSERLPQPTPRVEY